MAFAVIYSIVRGTRIERAASLALMAIALIMKYSNMEFLKYGFVIIPIIVAILLVDTIRDKDIVGLKRFALISVFLGSALVYLFKYNHWAGTSTLVILSIIASASSVYWIIKTRPFKERQFGLILFLTIDLILIQLSIF